MNLLKKAGFTACIATILVTTSTVSAIERMVGANTVSGLEIISEDLSDDLPCRKGLEIDAVTVRSNFETLDEFLKNTNELASVVSRCKSHNLI